MTVTIEYKGIDNKNTYLGKYEDLIIIKTRIGIIMYLYMNVTISVYTFV